MFTSPSIHYSMNISKVQTKGRKKRRCPELLQSYHRLRTTVGLFHRRQASREGSEGREGLLPARSFCFELDLPHVLCQRPWPTLTTRLGDLSGWSRACAWFLALLPAWGVGAEALVVHWNCFAAHSFIVSGLGESSRASSSTSFRKKCTLKHSVMCPG